MALTNVFNLPTISQILKQYQDTVQSENPDTNPYVPRTDWYVKGQSLAGITSGAYADIAVKAQNIYPQYRVGNDVDLTLAYLGLPPRIPETFGTGNCVGDMSFTYPFTVPSGTTLTDPNTGVIYTVYITTVVVDATTLVPFIANVVGIGNQENVGVQLTLTPAIGSITYLIVNNSSDGSNVESDSQANLRILNALRTPPAGARTTDYYNFVLEANSLLPSPEITDAIIIPNFLETSSNPLGVLGVFGLGGSFANDYLLNQSLINGNPQLYYDRTLSTAAVSAIETSIFNQKLIAADIFVATDDTFILPTYLAAIIQATVTLVPNVTLTTVLTIQSTDQNNNPITIQITAGNLILREIRRAIVNAPYTGVPEGDPNLGARFIPISYIEQSLDYGLASGNINGIYASILLDRQILTYNGTEYGYFAIPVPIVLNSDHNIQATYDVDYTNIAVFA
jgi:hypothetical protein